MLGAVPWPTSDAGGGPAPRPADALTRPSPGNASRPAPVEEAFEPPGSDPEVASTAADVSSEASRRRRDNPDPYLVTWGDQYLAYFTQGRSNVPLRLSSDWTTWSKPVDVLPVLPPWARPGRTWAPAVALRDGEWVLYFTAWHAGSGRQCIGTGIAASPIGPFEPSPEPIVCQLGLGGSIDPSPFADGTGNYLLWKSDENALGRPARLWSSRLDSAGTALAGDPVLLLTAEHAWEDPLIENPAMVTGDDGRRWLFYSAGPWETARYSTGLASCDGPLGPCRKVLHDRPWLGSAGDMAGPGGLDTFVAPNGERMAGLHAWAPDAVGYPAGGQRSVRIGHLDLTGRIPTFRPHVE
ncbi:MAG: glycoside hydrolase family 43 protein [Acidimicrobiia bacterium]